MRRETNQNQADVHQIEARHLPPDAIVGKRVRYEQYVPNGGTTVEEEELERRVGQVGIADARFPSDNDEPDAISVLFDDGVRFTCTADELAVVGDVAMDSDGRDVTPRHVQSSIAHASAPSAMDAIETRVKHDGYSDMEDLLWVQSTEGWTAPRWLTVDDVMFFYHTKNSVPRLRRLWKQAITSPAHENHESIVAFLEDQLYIAEQYAGSIFGCARVNGPSYTWRDEAADRDRTRHWRGNIYASIDRPYIFAHPIPEERFNTIITISPGGAYTPLHGDAFERLKAMIAETNRLPAFLRNAIPGGVDFRNVNASNWRSIACSDDARFIDESQIRAYFIDHLLEELKDPRTTVHQECRCAPVRNVYGYADYFVRIHGRWFPVEAKLNVYAERDLPRQVGKYVSITCFQPRRGSSKNVTIDGPCALTCLVIDSAGIYTVRPTGFVGCSSDQARWPRIGFDREAIRSIRECLRTTR